MHERSTSTTRLPRRAARARRAGAAAFAAAWLALACSTPPGERLAPPRFEFSRDTFAWANELYWQYDGDGRARSRAARGGSEPVEYGQRCIVMARAVRQFLFAARFEPDAPPVSAAEYRARVRRIFAADPRMEAPSPAPVTIPGFADLRAFSRAHEGLLKESIGGFFPTYFQRGNWRMILPFPARQQRATARALAERIEGGHLPIVHVANFPKIDINHALLLFAAEETPLGVRFDAYDPNQPEHPLALVFDSARAAFHLPRTPYFPGGRVKVYEIYRGSFF